MKGILFNEDLFPLVVSGEKTQTRRIKKGEKPRYEKGEIIYLKEPFYIVPGTNTAVTYKDDFKGEPPAIKFKWKNKLFMPAKYARHFIRITNIRNELLGDISGPDAIAEGCGLNWSRLKQRDQEIKARVEFFKLWIRINGRQSWADNPRVWVYDFEVFKDYISTEDLKDIDNARGI
jgi:hypothetical protein